MPHEQVIFRKCLKRFQNYFQKGKYIHSYYLFQRSGDVFICEVKSIVFYVVASFQKLSLTLSHFKAQHIITCYYDVVTPVHIFTGNGGICCLLTPHFNIKRGSRSSALFTIVKIYLVLLFSSLPPLLPSFSKRFQLGFSLHTLTFLLYCVEHVYFI